MHQKNPDNYVRLRALSLRALYTSRHTDAVIACLRACGALERERGGTYQCGVRAIGYRLAQPYRDGVVSVPLTNGAVNERAHQFYERASYRAMAGPTLHWIVRSYAHAGFANELDHVLTTRNFKSPVASLAVTRTVAMVMRHRMRFTVCEAGRVHYPITNLPSDLRALLTLDGQPTAEIDVVASQPSLLATLYRDDAVAERDRYLELVNSGRLYETIAELAAQDWDRKTAKLEFFKQIAFSLASNWHKKPLYRPFQRDFPELVSRMSKIKARHRAALSLAMQRLESDIMIKGACGECRSRGIRVLSVHDSLICRRDQADAVMDIVTRHWRMLTSIPCRLRIKSS